MKLFACGVVIACSTFVGFCLSRRSKNKCNLYSNLLSFYSAYVTNLDYRQLTVKRLIEEKQYDKEFMQIADHYLYGKENSITWLSNDEQRYVEDFFRLLGKSDAVSQKKELVFYETFFKRRYEESEQQYKSKGTLYKRLGVLIGLLVSILLI